MFSLFRNRPRIWTSAAPAAGPAPRNRGYAYENGWKSHVDNTATVYDGYYYADGFRWLGQVRAPRFGPLEFWIHNPPIASIRMSRWAGCFHARQNNWFFITFTPGSEPKDVDSGVAAVTHVLKETFRAGMGG